MGVEVLVPTGLFAMVVLIVFIAVNGGIQKRKAILATVQEAIRAGQQMTPETIRALGMIVFGWTVGTMGGEDEAFQVFVGMSAFPGFIGFVLLGFGLLGNKKTD